jgi:pyrroline-5-carboxylate reductase
MERLVPHSSVSDCDCVTVRDTPTEYVSLLLAVREAASVLVRVQPAVVELVTDNIVGWFDAERDVVSVCCALSVGTALSSVRENKMLRRGVQSVVPAVLVMYSAGVDATVHDPRKYCRVGSGSAPARNELMAPVAVYVQLPRNDV